MELLVSVKFTCVHFFVLSNETPEILLVRARDGAWTFFFRSGYTPRALLISRASPFYMTVTNLMKVLRNCFLGFLAILWKTIRWYGLQTSMFGSHLHFFHFFFFSVSFVRGPKWHTVDRRSLWNYIKWIKDFLWSLVPGIEAKCFSVKALCGDTVSLSFVRNECWWDTSRPSCAQSYSLSGCVRDGRKWLDQFLLSEDIDSSVHNQS